MRTCREGCELYGRARSGHRISEARAEESGALGKDRIVKNLSEKGLYGQRGERVNESEILEAVRASVNLKSYLLN